MPRASRIVKTRQRKPPLYKIQESKPISRSYAEASAADRKLIDMREAGHSWPEIRRAIADFTGEELSAPSTLPNRYKRLKANFATITDEDNAQLLRAKAEVDARFERHRWTLVRQETIDNGAGTYDTDVLQRQHRKLMMRAEYLAITGNDLGEEASERRMQAEDRAQAEEDLTTDEEAEQQQQPAVDEHDAEVDDDDADYVEDDEDLYEDEE